MNSVTQGTLIAERYRAIREIGFGGMGTVWLAYDEALDSQCAIKLIGVDQARQEEFRLRFECEAKCAAQLRSAHVVDVLNRGQWHGDPFIVMEYLEGEDLSVRLERVGRLDARATYRIVAQVARALMRAHMLGIVHRDIKPGNIFLAPGDDHEVAKLLDFGVAKHRALPNAFENLVRGAFIGTPCYMSPEQASGGTVDWRSDLWSLAVIVFECLTGELPFEDGVVMETILAIKQGPIPSLTAQRRELPRALEAWWQRAMARDPAQRFQSAKEFADAFADAIEFSPKLAISSFARGAMETPARSAAASACYESDAAVTINPAPGSATNRPIGGARAVRRREFPLYAVAVTAIGCALVLSVIAWRPALERMSGAPQAESGYRSVVAPERLRFSEALATEKASVRDALPSPAQPAAAAAAPSISASREPTVLVVAESPPPRKPFRIPAVKEAATPRLEPPPREAPAEPPEPRPDEPEETKDYGI